MQLLNSRTAHNGRTGLTRPSVERSPRGRDDVSKHETTTDNLAIEKDRLTTEKFDENDLTTEKFESMLADLLRTADQCDVETTRSLDVATGGEHTEWMVEITRIDRRP